MIPSECAQRWKPVTQADLTVALVKFFYLSFHYSMKSVLLCILFWTGSLLPLSAEEQFIDITAPVEGKIIQIETETGKPIYSGQHILTIKQDDGAKVVIRSGVSGYITRLEVSLFEKVPQGKRLGVLGSTPIIIEQPRSMATETLPDILKLSHNLYLSTGLSALITRHQLEWTEGLGRVVMILVGGLLLFLGIRKNFEPLLLIPIGFGAILSNIPLAGIAETGGLLDYVYTIGIDTGVFPLLIFMGVGALTDFGPMIANPKTALLGGAAQLGIFCTLLGALALNMIPGINFSLRDAASIGIIGGADGPTAIFLSSQLSPRLLGSIAVAAYSYMALVPIIQPPIMKWLTTAKERQIKMEQLRYVSKREKIIFPLLVLGLCLLFLPSAAPLIGMLMFGNLLRECGVVERLSHTVQNSLINTVTIFLGLGVGSKLSADKFLNLETLGILLLGLIAFCVGTAGGILMGKCMNALSKTPINPLIGAAGVSAVPMSSRVVNKVGLEANSQNFLLMHAMGPNVSGVIGSAVAAGVLLAVL